MSHQIFQRGNLLFLSVALIAMSTAAIAAPATSVPVPSSVSPGQVQKRFEEPSTTSTPNLQLPNPQEAPLSKAQQEALAKKQFVLKSVEFEGVTVYKPEDLAFSYQEMVGKKISLLDAQDIAHKITAFYHNNGYVLSQAIVPPQEVADGVLKVRVVEGYVSNVVIEGEVTDSQREVIQGYGDKIMAMQPVRTEDLERYLLLIDDLPGATVNGLLRPAQQSGAAELVLSMHDKQFDGSYTFDNRGSKYIGPWQDTFALGANSLLMPYDRTQIRLFTTTPDSNELIGVEFTHQEMLDHEGTQLSLLASHTHTQPGDILTPLQLEGDSNLGEVKITHPFIRLRQENLIGSAQLDYHDTITDIFKSVPFTSDRLRIARVGGTYNMIDDWRGNNTFDVQMSQGMNIFGASNSGTDRSNSFGDSSFTKFNGDISRLQPLPDKFSLYAAAMGQYSFQPLLADEQFSLGGPDWARAFDPAEVLGDKGIAAKAELRYTDGVGEKYFQSYQLYGFYDVGHIWALDAAEGTNSNTTLSSVGVGTRLNLTENFNANFEIAVPVIADHNDQTDYRGDPRLFMSLTAHF